MAAGDYVKTVWMTGDVITATKLNNNENKTDDLDKNAVWKDGSVVMTGDFSINKILPRIVLHETSLSVIDTQVIGEILFESDDADNPLNTIYASIKAIASETFGRTADLVFFVRDLTSYREVMRLKKDGTLFLGSNQVWNAGNDGSGSGLDADTVRGKTVLPLDGTSAMTGKINFANQIGKNVQLHNDSTIQIGAGVDIGGGPYELTLYGAQGPASQGFINLGFISDADGTTFTSKMKVKADGSLERSGTVIPLTRDNAGVLEFFTSGAWKAAGGVKSIQRGITVATASTTTNVTISSVVLAKSIVVTSSLTSSGGSATRSNGITLELTTATNLQIINDDGAGDPRVSWQVVEYN